VVRETAHLYLADWLELAEAEGRDETEFIAHAWKPFPEVLEMVLRGEIMDSMTVIAVLTAARRMGI
jgi:hypothetical protein